MVAVPCGTSQIAQSSVDIQYMLVLFQSDIRLKDSKSACVQRIALYEINNQSVFNSMWPCNHDQSIRINPMQLV